VKRWGALALAIVVLIVAVFVIGVRLGRDDGVTPVGDPQASGVALPPGVDLRGGRASSADAQLTIDGRSIETDASTGALRSLHLAGPLTVSIPGRSSADATDRGTVGVSGDDVTITSRSITLKANLLIRPGEVRLSPHLGSMNVSMSGPTTVRGTDITVSFGSKSSTRHGSFTFFADAADTAFGGEIRTTQPSIRWTDAPTSFKVSDQARSWTSWAGSARVRVGKRTLSHEFGAFAGRNVTGTITRGSGRVRATARAIAQQVYLDGVPQFETRATCDLIQTRERTEAGRRIELTWAPRNLGDFDMLMTRLVPVGPQAGWLSFGLEPAPHIFGGESRRAIGGQTTGFIPGGAIRSVLAPADADRRDVGVVIPAGTAPGTYDATVRIEGNFKPVTVPFEITVVGPQPT
jgi:hypothetical protein